MLEALFKLRREKGKALHKPVLLLTLIQEVERGEYDENGITENKVRITPELPASFKEIWSKLVTEGSWHCKFFLPFYHMKNDRPKFWFIQTDLNALVMFTAFQSKDGNG